MVNQLSLTLWHFYSGTNSVISWFKFLSTWCGFCPVELSNIPVEQFGGSRLVGTAVRSLYPSTMTYSVTLNFKCFAKKDWTRWTLSSRPMWYSMILWFYDLYMLWNTLWNRLAYEYAVVLYLNSWKWPCFLILVIMVPSDAIYKTNYMTF